MTLSQRLTRAGLVFVLLGSVAAALPQQNGAAQADTAQCGTTGNVYYRLTATADGTADTAQPTPATIGTVENFYFFQSITGMTGTYVAFPPTSFTSSGYTSTQTAGNHFTGTVASGANTVTANVTSSPSISVSDGTVMGQ